MFDLEQGMNQMMHQYKVGADSRIDKKCQPLTKFNKQMEENEKKIETAKGFVKDQLGPIQEQIKKMQSQLSHLSKENAALKAKPVVSPDQM